MAASKDELTALRNDTLCRLLKLVTTHHGEWKNKATQDNAITKYIQKSPLYQYERPGLNTKKILHDAESIRRLLTQTIGGNGRKVGKLGKGQRKPGIAQVFSEGAGAFDAEFLSSIGWDDRGEEDDSSVAEDATNKGLTSANIAEQRRAKRKQSPSDDNIRERSPKRKRPLGGSDDAMAYPSMLDGHKEGRPRKKAKMDAETSQGFAASETPPDQALQAPDRGLKRKATGEPDGAQRVIKKRAPAAGTQESSRGTETNPGPAVNAPQSSLKRGAEVLEIGESSSSDEQEPISGTRRRKKPKTESRRLATMHEASMMPTAYTDNGEEAVGGLHSARPKTAGKEERVVDAAGPSSSPKESQTTIPSFALSSGVAHRAPDDPEAHTEQTPLTGTSTASKHTAINNGTVDNAAPQAASHAKTSNPLAAAKPSDHADGGHTSTKQKPNDPSVLSANAVQPSMATLRPPSDGLPLYLHLPPSEIPISQRPADPVDMMWGPTATNVSSGTRSVWGEIEQAEIAYSRSHNVAHHHPTPFVSDPSSELEALYKTLFGTEDWRARVLELQSREQPFQLRQCDAIRGLISAAVYQKVYKLTLPWDLSGRLQESLGTDERFFARTIEMRGHPYHQMVKHTSWVQINDKEFVDTVVKPYAHNLAQQTAMTLLPHFRLFTKYSEPKPYTRGHWIESMELAFKNAMILKQKLASSEKGTFDFVWLKGDEEFSPSRHVSEYQGSRGNVCVTLYPGIYGQWRDEPTFIERVQVVALQKPVGPTD